jgi:hypothetical protein
MAKTVSYQEENLLCLVEHKDMLRWVEWEHRSLAQIEYVKEIQNGQGGEEHGIGMLTNDSIDKIHKSDGILGPRWLLNQNIKCRKGGRNALVNRRR